MRDDYAPWGNSLLCEHKNTSEEYCAFVCRLGYHLIRCDGYDARCDGYSPKKEGLAFEPINHVYAARLVDALRVYYHAEDEELNRLAENAFSGCAGTQRENQHELRDFLKGVK